MKYPVVIFIFTLDNANPESRVGSLAWYDSCLGWLRSHHPNPKMQEAGSSNGVGFPLAGIDLPRPTTFLDSGFRLSTDAISRVFSVYPVFPLGISHNVS